LPVAECSASSNDVIKKPDRVKNVDTPRYPPLIQETPPWNTSTASTASARTPSSAG